MALVQLAPGSMIAGRFRLERPLAKGGMGEVWVASDISLDVPVALKFMSQAAVGSEELVARFELEAKAAARLRHPHVVQILAHGVDRGVPFIAMELLEGEDLGARLKALGRLPLAMTARIVRDVCKPLQRAHAQKIVHRDLKPANIFLCKHDEYEIVKVLDFGIAKSVAEAAAVVTKSGAIVGSPQYMSPEQAQRTTDKVDHRSDLWALGVIAFRALTGQLPFAGANPIEVIVKVCKAPVPRPSSIAPDLGPQVDAFFAKALARDPESRFQSARELADAIASLAGLASEDGQAALHRSWSDERAPAPLPPAALANAPRIPVVSAAASALAGPPQDLGTRAEAIDDSAFDNATTVPLQSAGAQRAITGKPWATTARSVEDTRVDTTDPPTRGAGSPPVIRASTTSWKPSGDAPRAAAPRAPLNVNEPRVILAGENRPSAQGHTPGIPPSDNPARGPHPGAPGFVPSMLLSSDATQGAMATLTSSGAELPIAPAAGPHRDKPWVILIAAGAAVVVVLVVIGAVLATAYSSGRAAEEASPLPLGSSGTAAPGTAGGWVPPGLMPPVSVAVDKPPAPSASDSATGSTEAPHASGTPPGAGSAPTARPTTTKPNADKALDDEARNLLR